MAEGFDARATLQETTTGLVDRGPETGDREQGTEIRGQSGGPPDASPSGAHGPAVVGAMLAIAYLAAATLAPALLPAVTIAAALAACALALSRRDSRRLRVALAAIGIWLTAGFAGAWLLRAEAVAGLVWVLMVLFFLPLPLISWLYWLTFPPDPGDGANEPALRTPDTGPAPSRPAPEPCAPPITNHEPRSASRGRADGP
jgi:hypothetical protein